METLCKICGGQHITGACTEMKPVSDEVKDKYSPEAMRQEMALKIEKIRSWAAEAGLKEGKNFLVIESITDIDSETESVAPHEKKQFFVAIQDDNYNKFKEYILGQYFTERKIENPDNKHGGPKLDYSWGGRFAVGWDGPTFFDTVAVSSVENMAVPTHHAEFKTFFKQKAGFDFPDATTLNPLLRNMSEKGLVLYEAALEKLKNLRDQGNLPNDGWSLIDEMEREILILKDAKSGEAVVDLPEIITGKMPAKMRHYADLTYNAEDLQNLDKVVEITGISIPDELRVDKIFDKFGFDRTKMESICKDFSDYILKRN